MQIIIFSTKKRKPGEVIQLGNRNGLPSKGVVIKEVDDPKYKNQKVCGHKELVDTAKDYYVVEVKE